jgi:lipopolysaccharide assembly protein A
MTIILFILGFALGAAALLFALQNNEVVSLMFMGWQFESSLALLVIASVAAGMLISMLAFLPSALSGSFRIMGLKRDNQRLTDEVIAHRTAAVVGQPEPLI